METPYRQLSWLYLCFVNIWLFFNPFNLSIDWRFGGAAVITSLADPLNLLTLLTLAVVSVLGVWSVCGRGPAHRAAVVGLSLLVLPFLPASNLFFPVGFVIAERILYIPSMGFCMLVAYGAWNLVRRLNKTKAQRIVVGTALVYLIATHSTKTYIRNFDWESNMSAFKAGLKVNPRNGLLMANLGKEVIDIGDTALGEELIRRGTIVSPTHSGAYLNLGKVLVKQQRFQDAQEVMLIIITVIMIVINNLFMEIIIITNKNHYVVKKVQVPYIQQLKGSVQNPLSSLQVQ